MEKTKVYTELTEKELYMVPELIGVIKSETVFIQGHPDPKAIADCWNSLSEITDLMSKTCDKALAIKQALLNSISIYQQEVKALSNPANYNYTAINTIMIRIASYEDVLRLFNQ